MGSANRRRRARQSNLHTGVDDNFAFGDDRAFDEASGRDVDSFRAHQTAIYFGAFVELNLSIGLYASEDARAFFHFQAFGCHQISIMLLACAQTGLTMNSFAAQAGLREL